ncbi:MAG: hypothetical protein K2M91_12630, partial [Lachnospiraceae bacterium]|nr:hypothetical protein [Lachnospiraceae bacterium]
MRAELKNIRRIVVLFLMTAIVVVIVKWDTGNFSGNNINFESEESDSGAFELSVWSNNLCIKWWENEQDNSYYLFIPGSMKNKKMNLTFSGTDYIFIDNKKVTNGGRYRFTKGSHSLQSGDSQNQKVYQLEVLFTSDIASVFLETQSGTLDNIHASKEWSESGKMIILDSRGRKYFEGEIENIHCRGNAS